MTETNRADYYRTWRKENAAKFAKTCRKGRASRAEACRDFYARYKEDLACLVCGSQRNLSLYPRLITPGWGERSVKVNGDWALSRLMRELAALSALCHLCAEDVAEGLERNPDAPPMLDTAQDFV